MQSGCALNCFTRGRNSCTYELAHKLGIHSNNDKLILSELQKVPVDELYGASLKILDPFLVSHLRPFCPIIEPKSKEPGFLTEGPLDIIRSGRYNKVPMIMGYNTLEGIFTFMCMRNKDHHFLTEPTLVPHTLNLRIGSPPYKRVAKEIKKMYKITGQEDIKVDGDFEKALKIYTHNFIVIDVCRSAMLHCKTNKFPIYFYRFDLDSELNFIKGLSSYGHVKGAAHADDLAYLFTNVIIPPAEEGSQEHKLIEKVTTLWTNFAKYGNPTPEESSLEWKPALPDNFHYLSMENESFRSLVSPEKEFIDFWDRLHGESQVQLSKL